MKNARTHIKIVDIANLFLCTSNTDNWCNWSGASAKRSWNRSNCLCLLQLHWCGTRTRSMGATIYSSRKPSTSICRCLTYTVQDTVFQAWRAILTWILWTKCFFYSTLFTSKYNKGMKSKIKHLQLEIPAEGYFALIFPASRSSQ